MPWTRLDERFDENPKVVGLSDRAFRVLVSSWCYAARNLTDGLVPGTVASRLGATARMRRELLEAGLWEEIAGGFKIHDWLDYNPSAAEMEERREQKRSAGRAGGLARAKALAKQTPSTGLADGVAESKPEPEPEPEPLKAPTANRPRSEQPTHDSVYLAQKINDRWQATKGRLTPAGLQAILNDGVPASVLEDALRELHGFPPEEAVRSPHAYLTAIVAERIGAPA